MPNMAEAKHELRCSLFQFRTWDPGAPLHQFDPGYCSADNISLGPIPCCNHRLSTRTASFHRSGRIPRTQAATLSEGGKPLLSNLGA